jgi:hypothetical protein
MANDNYPDAVDAVQINLRLEVFRAEKCGKLPDDRVHVAGLIAEGVASALRGAIDGNTEAYKAGLIKSAVANIRALVELEKAGL